MATETKKVKKTTTYYTSGRDIGPSEKCPPQAKLILDIVKANGGKVERTALLALLNRTPDGTPNGGLKTNQTAERILGFYRPKFKAEGTLTEEKIVTEEEIQVEVKEKPAPAAAAAAPAGEPASNATAEVGGAKQEHKHKGERKGEQVAA